MQRIVLWLTCAAFFLGLAGHAHAQSFLIPEQNLPTGYVKETYGPVTIITEGAAGPVTFAIIEGDLPPGITMSLTGVLSGTPSEAGEFFFLVEATDGAGSKATADFIILVIDRPRFVTLSLPNGVVAISYSATIVMEGGDPPYFFDIDAGALPPGLSLGSTTGVISGTPTAAGTYTFTVQVFDSVEEDNSREYSITIFPPLTLVTTSLPPGVVGTPYSASVAVTGGLTPYLFSIVAGSPPPGLALNSTTGAFSGTPTATGSYPLTVRVSDATAMFRERAFTIDIAAPLVITTLALPNGTVGTPYSQTVAATGGFPTRTFSISAGGLPPGLSINSVTGLISGTPTTAGSFGFTVRVSDSIGTIATRAYTVVIRSRLHILTTSLPEAFVNEPYSATLVANLDEPVLVWSVVSGLLPPGLSLHSTTGVISGTPTSLGRYSFIVVVATPSASEDFMVSDPVGLFIEVGSPPLDFTPTELDPGSVGAPYSVTFTATGGSDPATFQVVSGNLPPGLTFNSATRILSGTPTTEGLFSFVLRATSGLQVIERLLRLRIAPPTLLVSPDTLPAGFRDEPYSQMLTASGGVAPYTFVLSGGALPEGLSLSSAGVVAGTPTSAGTSSFQILVTDAERRTVTIAYRLVIRDFLTLGPEQLPEAAEGERYSASLVATGGQAPYQFALESGSLPAGLMLSAAGVVSGVAERSGTVQFTARVTDAGGRTATRLITLPVVGRLTLLPETLPPAPLLHDYNVTLLASGGRAPYSFRLSGALPAGILFENGVFRGVPTAPGEYPLVATVTDALGRGATRDYILVVPVGPAILTMALPPIEAGVPYEVVFAAAGGRLPYRWSFTGVLPAGLGLNPSTAALSGTSSEAGEFNFTVRVEDEDRLFDTKPFRLQIAVPPAPPVLITELPGTAGPAQQPSFSIRLERPYPLPITGTVTLAFQPDVGPDDPAVQFAGGGRTLVYNIPANELTANFAGSAPQLQTGTVAGLITLTTRYSAGGADITPDPEPRETLRIAPGPPVLTRLDLTRTSTSFTLVVFGYTTARSVTQALVRFTPSPGANLTTTELTIQLTSAFQTYYAGAGSAPFGSQFRFEQTFNVTGEISALGSVSISMSNAVGTSNTLTANF